MYSTIKFKNHVLFKRLFFLTILVITFYIIFNFSAQDGEESGSISMKVTEVIVNILSKIKNIDIDLKLEYKIKLEPIIRKLAHFGIYSVVGFSAMGFMNTFNMKNNFKFITSFGIGVVYAITDEVHQYFIPGRSAQVLDVWIDSAGVLTGIFILIGLTIFIQAIVNWLKK